MKNQWEQQFVVMVYFIKAMEMSLQNSVSQMVDITKEDLKKMATLKELEDTFSQTEITI